jgi:hypothetical protein
LSAANRLELAKKLTDADQPDTGKSKKAKKSTAEEPKDPPGEKPLTWDILPSTENSSARKPSLKDKGNQVRQQGRQMR